MEGETAFGQISEADQPDLVLFEKRWNPRIRERSQLDLALLPGLRVQCAPLGVRYGKWGRRGMDGAASRPPAP